MSTRNFASVNNTAVYAVELDENDDNDLYLESLQESIIEKLKALKTDTRPVDAISSDNDRNYGGWCFGMVYGVDNGNYEYVTIELVQRHGYYSGANFDYVIGYLVEGDEYDDENINDAYTYSEKAQDYTPISATRIKRLQSQARALTKKVDKVLAEVATPLKVVGTFSNGEAVYENA